MSRVKTCPKCGSALTRGGCLLGYTGAATRRAQKGALRGAKVIPSYCENYGYIELYNEGKVGKT